MSGAPLVTLGDVCTRITDGTHQSPRWSVGGVPFLFVSNIRNGSISFDTDKFVSHEEYHSLTKNCPIEAGDVLYTAVGSYGNAAVVPTGRTFVFQRHIAQLKPRRDLVDPAYLSQILETPPVRRQADRLARGIAQKTVTLASLKQFQIPVPTLSEQRRIAAILDKADSLRRKRKHAIELLGSLAQSIFLEMFGDPVSNPKGFPLAKFGDVGRLDRGISKHRPRNDPALLGGAHPLIQTGDVTNSGGYVRSWSSTYSDLGLKQSKKWPAGTLCITIAANIAQTGILTFPACFPDSVVGFTHPSCGMVEFVRVWLSFLRSTLERIAPTVAQKNINLEILRGLDIAMPPVEMINEFGARIKAQDNLRLTMCDASSKYQGLFSSLQFRAFSGQL